MKDIYIVLSQTGTALSRALKIITGAEYNHASISLDGTLSELYSFGRVNPMNPVVGGFVKESKDHGTFKRFSKTQIVVLRRRVPDELYNDMQCYLRKMYVRRREFGYNYRGLFLAAAKIHFAKKKRFYCSEFVRYILIRFGLKEAEQLSEIVKPIDFLRLKDWDVVYRGNMQLHITPSVSWLPKVCI